MAERSGRRWFQFSLRTFLVCVAAFATWLGMQFNRPRITAENLDQLQVISRMPIDVWEIQWSPDGSRVAFLTWGKPADIRETTTLFRFGSLGVGKAPIHVAFSPDRNVVAYCENNTKVDICWLDERKLLTIDTRSAQPSMEFSPDGKTLATGGSSTHAALWDVATGKLVRMLEMGPIPGGLNVTFSGDGKTIAVGHRNAYARLFDVATGNVLAMLHGRMTHQVRFDPSGKRLAVSYVNGDIAIFDVQTGKRLSNASTGAEETYRAEWSPDGRLLATCGLHGDIIIWNPEDLSIVRRLAAPEWVINIKFTPDSTRLITAGGDQSGGQREVLIWAVPQPWTRWFTSDGR